MDEPMNVQNPAPEPQAPAGAPVSTQDQPAAQQMAGDTGVPAGGEGMKKYMMPMVLGVVVVVVIAVVVMFVF